MNKLSEDREKAKITIFWELTESDDPSIEEKEEFGDLVEAAEYAKLCRMDGIAFNGQGFRVGRVKKSGDYQYY